MVNRHTPEGAARRQALADAASLAPTDPPPYPSTERPPAPEEQALDFPLVPPTFSGGVAL